MTVIVTVTNIIYFLFTVLGIFVQPSKQEKQHLRPDYDRYNSIKRMIARLESHLRNQSSRAQKNDSQVFDTRSRRESNIKSELQGYYANSPPLLNQLLLETFQVTKSRVNSQFSISDHPKSIPRLPQRKSIARVLQSTSAPSIG